MPLSTSGNRIIETSTGAPVLLRGDNRSGLEYSEPDEDGFASAAGLSRYEIRHLVRDWRCNIIRLPFNQDWVLRGRGGRSGEEYLNDIDRVIDWAAAYGAYTRLDLQWLDADQPFGAGRQFVPPLPNEDSPRMWARLARRYRGNGWVLYDILNEPHDRLPEDFRPLPHHEGGFYPDTQRRVTMAEWRPWARRLIQAIRSEAADSVIFVSGTNWAYDLRGLPLRDVPNLVYSTHVYRKRGETRRDWAEAFGHLALTDPVFAGEWGGGERDIQWGRSLLRYFEELGIGWAAWSWSDEPFVVQRYAPTPSGGIIRAVLS